MRASRSPRTLAKPSAESRTVSWSRGVGPERRSSCMDALGDGEIPGTENILRVLPQVNTRCSVSAGTRSPRRRFPLAGADGTRSGSAVYLHEAAAVVRTPKTRSLDRAERLRERRGVEPSLAQDRESFSASHFAGVLLRRPLRMQRSAPGAAERALHLCAAGVKSPSASASPCRVCRTWTARIGGGSSEIPSAAAVSRSSFRVFSAPPPASGSTEMIRSGSATSRSTCKRGREHRLRSAPSSVPPRCSVRPRGSAAGSSCSARPPLLLLPLGTGAVGLGWGRWGDAEGCGRRTAVRLGRTNCFI